MRSILALLYYLLAVVGFSGGQVTDISSEMDGHDVLHGRIERRAGVAKFECLASSIGQCHFSLFDPSCADPATDCGKPPERFARWRWGRAGRSWGCRWGFGRVWGGGGGRSDCTAVRD